VFDALAYAPAPNSPVPNSPVERESLIAASAPVPHAVRPTWIPRNPMAANKIDSVIAKGPQGQGDAVAMSTRLAASEGNDAWMRVMMLAPSASTSMSTTVLGDTDMTLMRVHFVKPQAAIAMSFADDPEMGLVTDRFTGSAIAVLATQSFAMRRTAALH
jgi:hypothetical protein